MGLNLLDEEIYNIIYIYGYNLYINIFYINNTKIDEEWLKLVHIVYIQFIFDYIVSLSYLKNIYTDF